MMTSNCHLMENSECDISVAQNEKCTEYALIEYFHSLVEGCVTVCSPTLCLLVSQLCSRRAGMRKELS